MTEVIDLRSARDAAASAANAEDASLWRWFSGLFEERRIRWFPSRDKWLVFVDHKHVATESDFDTAIRTAKHAAEVHVSVRKRPVRRRAC